jgi:hypothetical protein
LCHMSSKPVCAQPFLFNSLVNRTICHSQERRISLIPSTRSSPQGSSQL